MFDNSKNIQIDRYKWGGLFLDTNTVSRDRTMKLQMIERVNLKKVKLNVSIIFLVHTIKYQHNITVFLLPVVLCEFHKLHIKN